MMENLNQEITLVVSDKEPDTCLSKLQIEGVTVRYGGDNSAFKYVYFTGENEGNKIEKLDVLKTLLPFSKVIKEVSL